MASDSFITTIVAEIKTDYQLPPYMPNESIVRAVKRCMYDLNSLNDSSDFITDSVGRGLLKDYVYYVLQHKSSEFKQNYANDILSWQLSAVSEVIDD